MAFNGNKITEYKDGRTAETGTRALGTTFDNEFNRLYGNDNALKEQADSLQQQITDLIGGAPSALNTLKELATALNDDASFATTVTNRLDAAYQRNLVYNGDFMLYSNKTGTANWYEYKHPDGWIFSDNGSDEKIGYDSSSECCKIISSSDGSSMSLKQALHEFPRWQNKLRTKKVTAKIRIKGSANITVKLSDGVNTVQQVCSGSGSIEIIQLQLTLNAAATGLWLEIATTSVTQTIEIYEAYCNLGEIALSGLACQIERIGLWQGLDEKYPETVMEGDTTEIPAGYTRLESWLNGRFGTGSNGRSKLPKLRGRFLRVWADGSTDDPDRSTRTDRGNGTTGDYPGTLQDDQNKLHSHSIPYQFGTASNAGYYNVGPSSGYTGVYLSTDGNGGNQANPRNINHLAGIRWA